MMDLIFSGCLLMSFSLSGVYGQQLQVSFPPSALLIRASPSHCPPQPPFLLHLWIKAVKTLCDLWAERAVQLLVASE